MAQIIAHDCELCAARDGMSRTDVPRPVSTRTAQPDAGATPPVLKGAQVVRAADISL